MSAYLVDHATINAIVAYALARFQGSRQAVTLADDRILFIRDADAIGDVLWKENNRSVNYRYDESTPAPAFRFDPGRAIPVANPGAFCKLLACLEYQSCETPDWERTAAYRLIARLRELACELIAGFEEAPWGLTDPEDATGEKE